MKALVLSSSPRRNGNSAILAEAVHAGLIEAGHDATLLFADDFLKAFLRDCCKCRKPDGECAIEDGYRSVFLDQYLPADGFIAATPIYWYGMSAQLKAFTTGRSATTPPLTHDRRKSSPRCKASASALRSARGNVSHGLGRDHQPDARIRPLHALHVRRHRARLWQCARRCRQGPVRADQGGGALRPEFFTRHTSDYQIDSVRPGRVWG